MVTAKDTEGVGLPLILLNYYSPPAMASPPLSVLEYPVLQGDSNEPEHELSTLFPMLVYRDLVIGTDNPYRWPVHQ